MWREEGRGIVQRDGFKRLRKVGDELRRRKDACERRGGHDIAMEVFMNCYLSEGNHLTPNSMRLFDNE